MRTSSSSTKRRAWALSWPGISCVWPTVLRFPPRQNRIENEPEEDEPHGEAGTFSKTRPEGVRHDDADDDADEWNDVEDDPPDRFADDLVQHDEIINRDDRRPPWLARLREDLPHRDDVEEDNDAPYDPEHRAGPVHRVRLLRGGSPRVKVAPR